ncbi:MAG: hybrid sensor histidine kinase/response regulator [Anaerolineae bacterium]|nr:hybrid sensor histidine kinase/response regulator [Anaerolineae bacterium]
MDARASLEPAQAFRLNKQDVDRAIFNRLLMALVAIQYAILWHMALVTSQDLSLLVFFLAAALVLLALWRVGRRSLQAGKLGLVGACFLGAVAVQASHWEASWLLALPVLVAGALYRPVVAAVLAVLSVLLIELRLPDPVALSSLFVIATGVLSWLTLQPLHQLLLWHSQRSLEATALAEQLRDQRGKLNRTIKALDDSYQLLEKTNRELLLARREADALRDLRSRFATNLSHELRTPLNIILGFSHLIYTKPQLYGMDRWPDALLRDLSELRRNAGYLSDLVDDIVDLARVDALAMPIRREPSDLAHVIQEAVAIAEALAQEKGLSIRVSCDADIPPLAIDPVRIRQVLFNLLTNAVRHTEKGSIHIEATTREGEVVVSVSDSGHGIPQEELASIFDEFYQVGRPKHGPDSGKGLGLAIARRFVQLHGGSIWVESTVGVGSTFSFSLPLADKPVSLSRPGRPLPTPKARSKPLVLVLNDDGTAAGYLRRRLESCDFAPVPADRSPDEMLVGEAPAAVVINTPVSSPAPAQHPLAALLPEAAPVIECSLPSSQWLSGAKEFSAVLTKPVTQEKLLEALKAIVPEPSRATVLIADDDRSFVQLIRRMLQSSSEDGYGVLTAYGGAEALRKARRYRPDAILLDLLMPDMNGFDVLAAIRQEPTLRGIPVVAVTAATPGEDEMAQRGAYFRLTRRSSFRPGELVSLISLAVASGATLPEGHQDFAAGQPVAPVRTGAS